MGLDELYEIIRQRKVGKPTGSYVANLIAQGNDRIIQKVGEEAIEVAIAAKNINKARLISESADLLFHLLILLEENNIVMDDIYAELKIRSGKR